MESKSERLEACTRQKIELFDSFRKGLTTIPFWDMLVLTATDKAQAESYRQQLKAKSESAQIPPIPFYVFGDPAGPKIGNGGATLHALTLLKEALGPDLLTKRVLLIHAGGFSTRLPTATIVGKIFTALPLGDPLYQMLEMKLAMYIDFPSKMNPGVFVTCADDIEVLDSDGELRFMERGFTALGHPSSLEIGTTHGVFVLDKSSLADKEGSQACVSVSCREFLHKPSVSRMEAKHAPYAPDLVYTDSAYYFDSETMEHLLAFYHTHRPLSCEIDAYGDFLQALGPDATDEYTRNNANVILADEGLSACRSALCRHLKGTPLHVILCKTSKFYHIGTIPEYLNHLCVDEAYRRETQALRRAFSFAPSLKGVDESYCVMHSFVGDHVAIGSKTVLEYCDVSSGSTIGPHCLLSNVVMPMSKTVVPGHTFMHTTCLKDGFVTIVFATNEDLKTSCTREDFSSTSPRGAVTYCTQPLRSAVERIHLNPEAIFRPSEKKLSLWNAKIFGVFDSADDSFLYALGIMTLLTSSSSSSSAVSLPIPKRHVSMEDILQSKDLSAVLAGRACLAEKIRLHLAALH